MFTGVRPAPLLGSRPGSTAVRLDPDRFDAGVRDGLVRFFERALRAVARERFSTADDMRDAFIKALHNVPEHENRGADQPVIAGAVLQGKGPDASVGELPLSTRQQNALDRMGIYTLHNLAQLSSNRLGGVRGVGAKTARSLVDLAKRVRDHLEMSAGDVAPPLLRGFAGARRDVEEEAHAGALSPPLARRLIEAGLVDAATVASAPQTQVKNLVNRARKDGAPESLKDLVAWLEGLVDAERVPTTLGAAAELIAPATARAAPRRSSACGSISGSTTSRATRATAPCSSWRRPSTRPGRSLHRPQQGARTLARRFRNPRWTRARRPPARASARCWSAPSPRSPRPSRGASAWSRWRAPPPR